MNNLMRTVIPIDNYTHLCGFDWIIKKNNRSIAEIRKYNCMVCKQNDRMVHWNRDVSGGVCKDCICNLFDQSVITQDDEILICETKMQDLQEIIASSQKDLEFEDKRNEHRKQTIKKLLLDSQESLVELENQLVTLKKAMSIK